MQSAPIPPAERERLAALRDTALVDTPPDEGFDDLTKLAVQIFGVPIAILSLIEEDRQFFKSKIGLEITETPRDLAFCAHTILHDRPMVIPDASCDLRFHDNPFVTGDPKVRFYAGARLLTADGHAIGAMCAIDNKPRQMSEGQIEALAALARQATALIELRRRAVEATLARDEIDRFFTLSLDPLCIAGFDGRFRRINPVWEQVLGWSREELMHQPFLSIIHPEDKLESMRELKRVIGGTSTCRFENRCATKGGRWRWLSWTAAPFEAEHLLYVVVRDRTDEKAVEEVRQEFASTVSHELRTPLTSMCGSLRLLQAGIGGALPEEAKELVDIAEKGGQRLLRLVNDILDIEKFEAGRLELCLSDVDVEELLRTCTEGLNGYARQGSVEIRIESVPGLSLRGDFDRLLQVLTNLVSNAIKHSPEGSVVVVRGGHDDNGGGVRIEVEDAGPGIRPEEQHKLFEKFRQLGAKGRPKGGTGLGLAISKAIVLQHSGAIGVDSPPGKGATFWIELPREGA